MTNARDQFVQDSSLKKSHNVCMQVQKNQHRVLQNTDFQCIACPANEVLRDGRGVPFFFPFLPYLDKIIISGPLAPWIVDPSLHHNNNKKQKHTFKTKQVSSQTQQGSDERLVHLQTKKKKTTDILVPFKQCRTVLPEIVSSSSSSSWACYDF